MTLEYEDCEIYQLKCWKNHNHVYSRGRILIWIYCTLFSFIQILSYWVLLARFLMRQLPYSYDHPRESVIKCENLQHCGNLWMIIHNDVYLFMAPYKRKGPLMKINSILSMILFSLSYFPFLILLCFATKMR